jgi:RNA polymerase sigma factor (sigma-70 family)
MEIAEKESIQRMVDGCVQGDQKSQHELYQLYYSKMMGVCYRYANDPEEAKDILHDGFLKVYANISKYNYKGSLEGWVRRIVVNTAIDHFRKFKNIFSMSESNIESEMIQSHHTDYDANAQMNEQELLKAINNLSPAYKLVFNLYAIEGYSHKEIAEKLSINIGTSKSNLAKARMNLQKELEKKYNYKHGEY